jgi:antitoxin component YwqK of YwqJK toxin-antitoxin module
VKWYHPNGKLESEVHFINGKGQGQMTMYYDNGKILASFNLLDNKRHGKLMEYFKNGNLRGEVMYVDGNLNGILKQYYENGNIEVTKEYSNGVQNGKESGYYENGQLTYVGKVANGVPEGKFISYHPNGKIKKKGIYVAGDMTKVKHYDERGKEKKTEEIIVEETIDHVEEIYEKVPTDDVSLQTVSDLNGVLVRSKAYSKSFFDSNSGDFDRLKITMHITTDGNYLRSASRNYAPADNEILVLAQKVPEGSMAGLLFYKIGKSVRKSFANGSLSIYLVNNELVDLIAEETGTDVKLWSEEKLQKEADKQ